MIPNSDTIAAIATPPGQGGVGIVRVSGAAVPDIARQLRRQLPASDFTHTTDRLYKWRNARGEWQVTDAPPPAGTPYEKQDYRDDVNVLPVPPGIDAGR